MRIWLKPERMAALSISPAQVRQALASNNYLAAVGRQKDRSQSQPDGKLRPAFCCRVQAAGHKGTGRCHSTLEDISEIALELKTMMPTCSYQGRPLSLWQLSLPMPTPSM